MEKDLSGEWRMKLDPEELGENEKWFISGKFPVDYILKSFPVSYSQSPFHKSGSAWLMKEFQIKKTGTKYYYLVFFGSDKGKIWLNDKEIGVMKRISGKQVYDITNFIKEKNCLVLKFEDIKDETLGLWKNAFIMEETSVPAIAKKYVRPIPKWADKAIIYSLSIRNMTTQSFMDEQIRNLPYLRGFGINTICILPDTTCFIPDRFINYAHKIGFKIIMNIDSMSIPYGKKQTMRYLNQCMLFWVMKYNIDGFLFQSPSKYSINFWKNTISKLRSVKSDILLIAKEDNPNLYLAGFDLTYDSHLSGIIEKINKKYYDVEEFNNYIYTQYQYYPQNSKRIIYLEKLPSSKDISSSLKNMMIPFNILKLFIPGIPLIDNIEEILSQKNQTSSSKEESISYNNKIFNKFYREILMLKKNSTPMNDHSADSFFFNKGLSYFEIIRTSMDKKINAVFDSNQSSITIFKNGRKHIMLQNYKYA